MDVAERAEVDTPVIAGNPAVFAISAVPNEGVVEVVDTVTFVEDDERFLVRAGVEVGDEPRDLCGLWIGHYDPGGGLGSDDLAYLTDASADCEAEGVEPVEIVPFTAETGFPHDAVVRGEIDATPVSESYAAFKIGQSPELSLGGPVMRRSAIAFVVGKDNGLAEPMAAAIDELVSNGTYERIMDSYGLPNSAPEKALVNVISE